MLPKVRWVSSIETLRYIHISTSVRKKITPDVKVKRKVQQGSMKERLEALEEQAYLSNPNSSELREPKSLEMSEDISGELREKLIKVTEKYPEEASSEHQRAISIAKLPSYADKNAREIAMSRPWNGQESGYDVASRMKHESSKPLKAKAMVSPKPVRKQQRLHNAREGALDYRLSKLSEKPKKKSEDDEWREMYKERLLGPAVLVSDTVTGLDNSIKSLADQRIMEARRRGDFKNIQRGKPLDKGFTTNGAYIDRTEYHLNRILKKQDAVPPWIEKQGSVDVEIEQFRRQLDQNWTLRAVSLVEELNPGLSKESLLVQMEQYSSGAGTLRSKLWERDQKGTFLSFKVHKLNDSIRGYNLQAPLASQRFYLDEDKELQKCYERVRPTLADSFRKYRMKEKKNQENQPTYRLFGRIGGQEIPVITDIPQMPTEPLRTTFWNMFKKNSGNKV
ncbi:DEKNAAC103538 [Brettanomyces naardenensis]|uniref:DEKNAAC103538 n=1 Tax=Brettanomyces naardenensis TaxID=13370 RepID=A0A448YN06_BRENA|nr:DEKNAAC103538 [Brettanomyces naardenensis]